MLYRISFLLCVVACAAQPVDFSAEQVAEDIDFLHTELKKYHPGLYRYSSKEEMDEYFNLARTSDGLSQFELYGRVTALLSKVKCGHTRSRMSDATREKFETEEVFLPFTVKFFGDKTYIAQTLDSNLTRGMEIRSINGRTMDEIKSIIYDHQSADGDITTGKQRLTEYAFEVFYQLYVDRGIKEYILEVIPSGSSKEKQVTVKGVPNGEVDRIRASFPNDNLLGLEHREDYSYMRIRTFGSESLNSAGENYERFLRNSFKELKERGVKNLVLDLRGNGGGRDNYGALLVSYLAQDSFGYFDNIKVTSDYSGSSIERDGEFYMPNHQGLNIWQPQEDAFTGDVYVLTDGFSFSTCADVATVLHHHGWATFLGEETGGGYDGNTSGDTRTIRLPNSGAIINIPMWMYTTANLGHEYQGRGVIPDYPIIQTWEAYEVGRDEVMEKAVFLVESRK